MSNIISSPSKQPHKNSKAADLHTDLNNRSNIQTSKVETQLIGMSQESISSSKDKRGRISLAVAERLPL